MIPRGRTALFVAAWLGACAADRPPPPEDLAFARALIERDLRSEAAAGDADASGAPDAARPSSEGAGSPSAAPIRIPPAPSRADAWLGLLSLDRGRMEDLEALADDDGALSDRLLDPIPIHELAALAVLRSPDVRAAWEAWNATRTSYQQSQDLGDLVALYRSFAVATETRVGPDRSRRPTETLAPSPNVDRLSAEVAHRATKIAFETLRATIRGVVAKAFSAHADAARWNERRRILSEDVELDRVLLEVLRARLEAGRGDQAGYLAFQARLELLQTELDILEAERDALRARFNRLLSRPESSEVALDLPAETAFAADRPFDEEAWIARALLERQELRAATLARERAELALRLAETMTLPRMDLGSSRFERERAGEASILRAQSFPEPGRMMPRADFGVREAQVQEMRARLEAARQTETAWRDRVAAETRQALFLLAAARDRVDVLRQEVVPLAESSLEAARGSYEGNQGTYLDLLGAIQRLLDARLGLADASRDLVYAQAGLLEAAGVLPESTEHPR